MYNVNLYGSHPDANNDDCWTGDDFETKEQALMVFNNPWEHFNRSSNESCTAYIEIDGPDINQVRANPSFRKAKDCDDGWKREFAMQAGMVYGCNGYNDAMGFDIEFESIL